MRSTVTPWAIGLLLMLGAIACGGDSTRPEDAFRGDYVLQTIGGKPLPYTWTFTGGNYYRLNSYRITIIPGGSWLSSMNYTYTDQGQVINRPNGGETGTFTYTPSSGFVSLISQDKTTFFTGTVSGDTMTLDEDEGPWVFKRSP